MGKQATVKFKKNVGGEKGERKRGGIQPGDVRRLYAINCFNTEVRTAGR